MEEEQLRLGQPVRYIGTDMLEEGVALWRFMKHAMRDWKVGEINNPEMELATAVAASSAFPPVLSPLVLKFHPSVYSPDYGAVDRSPELRERVILTDAGVCDSLGLETAWKRSGLPMEQKG